MLISAHIITAAAAGTLTTNPFLAFGIGALSHFAGDKIPHWEYDVNAIHRLNDKKGVEKLKACFEKDVFRALACIGIEVLLGFVFVWWMLSDTSAVRLSAGIAGALGGFLPDMLWGMANNSRLRVLKAYRDFHHASHSRADNVSLRFGLTWQIAAVLAAYYILSRSPA